jgi:hypothetical protein
VNAAIAKITLEAQEPTGRPNSPHTASQADDKSKTTSKLPTKTGISTTPAAPEEPKLPQPSLSQDMLAFARQELSTWPVYINNRITTAAAPRCSDRPRLLAAEALLLETYRSVVETLQGAFRFVQGLLARA